MKRIMLIPFFLMIVFHFYAQDFYNGKYLTSPKDIVPLCSAIDTLNKFVYYVGRFNDELIVTEDLRYMSNGSWDGYIMKTDYEGELFSLITYGSKDNDGPSNIIIDKTGNLFLASTFKDSVIIQGNKIKSSGDFDIFLSKFDKYGTCYG